MEIKDITNLVFLVVFIALIISVGLYALGTFQGSDGISETANANLNQSINILGEVNTVYLSVIVALVVVIIIVTIMVRGFKYN